MSKELYFTDGNNEVKYLDTTASFNLAITQDGSAFDLTNATSIDVKVANDTGYVFTKSIDMATIKQPLAGLITMPVDAEVMNALVPDDYTIEVWVTLSSLVTPGSQEGLTDTGTTTSTTATTTSTTGTTTYNAIFPSDDPQGFTITENVMSDSGDVIPVMSLDDFQQEFDQLKTDLTNKVSTLQGPKGEPGEGLDIKGKVDTTSQLPATASEGDGYLVNEELYVWTNGTWKDCGSLQGPQGVQGKTGTGVSSTTIQYQISNSATTTPTGTWSNTLIATMQVNPFLWTQVTLNYDDGTSKSFYLVSSKGDKGDKGDRGNQIFNGRQYAPNTSGYWWSDLTPAPSVDNPPKIGDTIITPSGDILQIDTIVVGGAAKGGGTFGVGNVLENIKGATGPVGPVGAGLVVKGTVNNVSQLPTTGNQEGYCYFVGTDLYVWDAGAWKNCGSVSPDLSNYVTVTDLNNGLSAKQDKIGYTPADDSTVVHTADMRKPASDVVGLEDITQTALPDGTDFYTLLNTAGRPLQYFANGFVHAQTMINKPKSALSAFILITIAVNNRPVVTYNYTFLNLRDISTGDSYEALISTDGTGKITVARPWHKLADDSKVAHLSGANNFDTVPTVNNNPLLLASSLPSDLARTGSDQEFTGKNTFDVAPIDKATGNPYITKDGVPAVPSTLADTTKDANFTGKLQKSGIDVATKSDVTTAISAATANMVDSSKPTNFTAGLQSKGVDVATAADIKSVADKAWYQLDNKYITPASGHTLAPYTSILYKIDDSNHKLYLSGSIAMNDNVDNVQVTIQLGSIIKAILTSSVTYLGYFGGSNFMRFVGAIQSSTDLSFFVESGVASIISTSGTNGSTSFVTYDELV